MQKTVRKWTFFVRLWTSAALDLHSLYMSFSGQFSDNISIYLGVTQIF